MKNKIVIIIGPTCTGKTSLALDLCKELDGEIISADSRQLYKYMDIGTGKVPSSEKIKIEKKDKRWVLDGINVWGYDLVAPDSYFSAYDFAEFALKKANSVRAEKPVFLVGGTGFYVDVFTGNIKLPGFSPDFDLRNKLEKNTLEQLKSLSTSLNLEIKNTSEKSNKQRIIRNIEKALSREKNSIPLPYLKNVEFLFLGLSSDRNFLYTRADLWVNQILEKGIVDEVTDLRKLGYGDSPKLHGLIYGQVSGFLDNKISYEECEQKMKYSMHAYIRRQETYFKKMSNIKWFDVGKDSYLQNVYNQVKGYVR